MKIVKLTKDKDGRIYGMNTTSDGIYYLISESPIEIYTILFVGSVRCV